MFDSHETLKETLLTNFPVKLHVKFYVKNGSLKGQCQKRCFSRASVTFFRVFLFHKLYPLGPLIVWLKRFCK